MSELKQENPFNLPLKAIDPKQIGTGTGVYPVICADCQGDNIAGVIGHLRFESGTYSGTGRYMDYSLAKRMAEYACLAINSHDQLVSAVAEKDKSIKKIHEKCEFSVGKLLKHNEVSSHDKEMM